MEIYQDILLAVLTNDLQCAESLINLMKHNTELKVTFETNYLDLLEKKSTDVFLKLYILIENKWFFFDYGWLKNGLFYAIKSKILVFNIYNIETQIVKHDDSSNHVIIVSKNMSYLLYTPHKQIIDIILSNKKI